MDTSRTYQTDCCFSKQKQVEISTILCLFRTQLPVKCTVQANNLYVFEPHTTSASTLPPPHTLAPLRYFTVTPTLIRFKCKQA